jgi:hypothetical protein
MIALFASPDAEAVKPVTSPTAPDATAVYLKVTNPLVKTLGLCRSIFVAVLSHCVELTGTGKILGVGLIVIITTWFGPSLHVTPLTGVIV